MPLSHFPWILNCCFVVKVKINAVFTELLASTYYLVIDKRSLVNKNKIKPSQVNHRLITLIFWSAMFKKFVIAVATVLFVTFGSFINSASAIEITEEIRTLPVNEAGETVVVSEKEYQKGKRLFNDSCSQCHVGGVTKTNPDVSLGTEALANAYPARDNIQGLVDYMKNPTTYDGFVEISELHPSLKSADIFPEMRNITEDDLAAIASYILIQPKILNQQWGGGKIYR